MPPPRRLSPHRSDLRLHSPRSSFRSSWSPREQQRSRSPQRARFSRSPRRHSQSSYKSSGRRSRESSRDHGYILKCSGYRSQSSSPVQAKMLREDRSPIDKRRRHHTHSRSRSPIPPSPCGSKTYEGMPLTLRRQDARHDTIDFVKIVDRGPKMEKLDKRFQTLVQVAQGPFDFEFNITIGILQHPSHMEIDNNVDIPVNYEFNLKTMAMIFPSKDYTKCIFDRDEIKAFHHDDVLDEEAYVEKKIISLKPVGKPKHSKYDDDDLDYKITLGMDRDWLGNKQMVKDFGSRSHQSRGLDPRYERDHRRHEERSISHERIHKNLDDLSTDRRRKQSDEDDFRRWGSRDLEHKVRESRDLVHRDSRDWDRRNSRDRDRRDSRDRDRRDSRGRDRRDSRDRDHRESRDRDRRESRDRDRRESRDLKNRDRNSQDRVSRTKVNNRKQRDKFRDNRYRRPSSDSVDDFQPESDSSCMVGKITPVKFTTAAERRMPVILTDLPNFRNRPGVTLIKPKVWIIGSTVIKDIQKFCEQQPQFDLQKQLGDVVTEVNYHGENDMKIADLLPAVKYMMKLHDLPQMIIFQCAEHNVCVGRNIDLLHSMKKDLLLIKADIPNVKLVWGQMLPPWMDNDLNGLTLAKSRRRINRFMMQCFVSDEIGGAFLYHSQIRTDRKTRFFLRSSDRFLHLNIFGMETLLMQFKAGIKYFCTGHGSIFPCFQWPPTDISKIEPECICMLDREHIQDISESQFNALTREQIQQLSIDQINMFNFIQIPWLFCKHFIQNLSPLQINSLTTQNFKHVIAEQLECFTDDQEKWLAEDVKVYIEMKRAEKIMELAAKKKELSELQNLSSESGNAAKRKGSRSTSSIESDGSPDYANPMMASLVPYESPELSPTMPPGISSPPPAETWMSQNVPINPFKENCSNGTISGQSSVNRSNLE